MRKWAESRESVLKVEEVGENRFNVEKLQATKKKITDICLKGGGKSFSQFSGAAVQKTFANLKLDFFFINKIFFS